jgi:hypothetical protein
MSVFLSLFEAMEKDLLFNISIYIGLRIQSSVGTKGTSNVLKK